LEAGAEPARVAAQDPKLLLKGSPAEGRRNSNIAQFPSSEIALCSDERNE
jgi:hypothetical protein